MLNTASLPVGSQTITASYRGNTPFLTSGATITVSILSSIIVLDPTAGGGALPLGKRKHQAHRRRLRRFQLVERPSANGNAQIKAAVIDVHGGVQKSGNASFSPAPDHRGRDRCRSAGRTAGTRRERLGLTT